MLTLDDAATFRSCIICKKYRILSFCLFCWILEVEKPENVPLID